MALPSRRRLVVRAESAILRAIRQTEELGLTVVGAYDALYNADGVSWGDVRSRHPGPTITLTGSPTLSNGVYTFNGTDQYGRNASPGRLAEIANGNCAIVTVYDAFTPAGLVSLAALGGGATTTVGQTMAATPALTVVTSGTGTTSAATAGGANGVTRVGHAWRSGTGLGARRGAVAAATVTPTTFSATTVDRLTVAANTSNTPTQFAAVALRTLVVISGAYTSGAQDIWNQYGVLRGATV